MPQSLPKAHPSVPISRHSEAAHPLSHRLARLTSVVQRRHYPQCLPGREPHQPPPVNVVCYTSRAPVEDHPVAPPPCCRAPCRDDDQPHVLQNPACPSLFPHHFLPSFLFPGPTHLLVEHRLGLSAETALLAVVTPLTCARGEGSVPSVIACVATALCCPHSIAATSCSCVLQKLDGIVFRVLCPRFLLPQVP